MHKKERRTTVMLKEEHRAILHALAVRRGWKGYSRIIAEALDYYFAHAPEVNMTLQELTRTRAKDVTREN